MNKKIISLTILCILLNTMITPIAAAYENQAFGTITKTRTHTWIASTTQPIPNAWFHYDDGSCENALGLTTGGTLYEVIKLTPQELGQYPFGCFQAIKVMHGCPLNPGCPETPFTAWIYYGTSQPSNPETGATIIATGTCPAIDDYFYVNFTTPYFYNITDTVWLGIGWTHPYGTYPCGYDEDTCTQGKGDFLWFPGGQWYELEGIDYPGNWDFEVLVGCPPPPPPHGTPPVTNCTITGIYPVTITLTATDPDDPVAATFFKFDSATEYIQYSVPFTYNIPGKHTIMFFSVDSHGNEENPQTKTFNVSYPLTITVKDGVGVTVTIHNIGSVDITITGNIVMTGSVFPKHKPVAGKVPPGRDLVLKKFVFGFGNMTIKVRVHDNVTFYNTTKDATVFSIFVF